MKDMIKRVREEKGGFTLAELLIVVAIILVLVAIAVPVFTGAQDKANEATRDANIRSAKSTAMVYILENYDSITATSSTTPDYKVEGTIAENGDITITSVTPVAHDDANVDYITAANSKDTTGSFVAFLTPTDIKLPSSQGGSGDNS